MNWISYTKSPINPLDINRQRKEASFAFEKHKWSNYLERTYKHYLSDSSIDKINHSFQQNPISFTSIIQNFQDTDGYENPITTNLFKYWSSLIPTYFVLAAHPVFFREKSKFYQNCSPWIKEENLIFQNKNLIFQKFSSDSFSTLMSNLFSPEIRLNFFLFPISHESSIIDNSKVMTVLENLADFSPYISYEDFKYFLKMFHWGITTHKNVKNSRPICVYSLAESNPISIIKKNEQLNIKWDSTDDLFTFVEKTKHLQASNPIEENTIFDLYSLEQLATIKKIDLIKTKIAHIEPLQAFHQIHELNIDDNYIWNMDNNLSKLVQLKKLSIKDMILHSYNFLSDLSNLTTLKLINLSLPNQTFNMVEMPKLQELVIHNGNIHQINFNSNLEQLKTLSISSRKITDIGFLKNCPNLSSLTLDETEIIDFSPFQYVPNLQSLSLNGTELQGWKFIIPLKKLRTLSIASNELETLSCFSSLTQLEQLYAYGNLISDIREVKHFPNLTLLDLSQNRISNLKEIPNLPKLVSLNIGGNPIDDFTFKQDYFKKLTYLNVGFSKFSNLQHILHFRNLKTLSIAGTNINTLYGLEQLTALKELDLAYCPIKIKDLYDLVLPKLNTLGLGSLKLNNIGFIKNFPKLKKVILRGSSIENISADDLQSIETLNIWNTKIKDFSFLLHLKKLKKITLMPSQIEGNILVKLRSRKDLIIAHS